MPSGPYLRRSLRPTCGRVCSLALSGALDQRAVGTTEQLLHLRQQWNEVKENKQLAHLHHGGLVASMWNDAGLRGMGI